jgi:hypothetical protein
MSKIFAAGFAVATLVFPSTQLAQLLNPHGSNLEDAYQISYASNLNIADGVVVVSNAGSASGFYNASTPGNICANIYVYDPQASLLTCCSCLADPNSLHSWPVSYGPGNLLANVPPSRIPTSVTIKLVATSPSAAGGTCSPTSLSTSSLVPGMAAWGTRFHPTSAPVPALSETKFTNKGLSLIELTRLNNDCATLSVGLRCSDCATGSLAQPALTEH